MADQNRIRQLLEMMDEDPADPFCRYALGLEYAGDPESRNRALDVFLKLRESHPDYLPVYYQLAVILKQEEGGAGFEEVVRQGMELADRTGQKKTFMELEFLLDD